MTAIGHPKSLDQARQRLGEPIEAVCSVSQGGSLGKRMLKAGATGQATRLSIFVLTSSGLHIFEPVLRGFGTELLHVPYSDITHIEQRSKLLATAFRLTLTDGSHLDLRALRGKHRGRDTVDRLTTLITAKSKVTPADRSVEL